MDDTVERLHQRLAQALQRTRRDAFTGPVTVAEIYQELVPYRTVRGEAGFDMNADYEHALLRLLAGEGDLARLEPAHAREQITRELKSPNPNVSIYREYAGCDVFVNAPEGRFEDPAASLSDVLSDDDGAEDGPWDDLLLLDAEEEDADEDALPFSLVDAEPEPQAKAQTPNAQTARNERPVAKPAQQTPPPSAPAPRTPSPNVAAAPSPGGVAPAAEAAAAQGGPHCAYCDAELPAHRPVRFCPYCGQDQTAAPCPSCGEALEPGWTFCVACGAARTVP